jgi:tetratricopeptide (TPR) repeat protein
MPVRPSAFLPRLRAWLLPTLVFALALFCYWPAMHGVQLWDDPAHIPQPEMRTWEGLGRMWTEANATQQYYPVLFSAFWVEHRLWGDSMFGYHLCNAMLHALCGCLLAAVVRRLWALPSGGGPRPDGAPADTRIGEWAAWLAALLFTAHPVGVESVAWVTEQKNTLSLFFGLLAAWAYLGFEADRRPRTYALATVLFVAALGSKITTATLPAILLVLLWWRNGTLRWRRDVLPLVPWFALSFGVGLLVNWIEHVYIGATGKDYVLTLGQRVLLSGRIVWFFLAKSVWPPDYAFFYRRWDVAVESAGWFLHFGAAVATMGLLWAVRRKTRGPLAAWLVLGGALFPVLGYLNVFSFQFSFVADHYYYIAIAGAAGAAASGAAWLLARRSPGLRLGAGASLAVAIGALALLSHGQSALYVDNETLFRDNVTKVPDSWMAHRILAHTISKTPGREAEVIAHYREALRHKPDQPDSMVGLGVELAKHPETCADAIALYRRAIELRPHYIEAHNNLGALLATLPGGEAEAIACFERALSFKPDFLNALLNLGDTLLRVPGRAGEAAACFEKVLRRFPNHAEAHRRYGVALAAIPGRGGEALAHFEQARQLSPGSALVNVSYGNALAQTPGRMADAAARFAEAVRLDPSYAEAHAKLGNALLALGGRQAEALEQLQIALRLDPHLNHARNNAAMLLAGTPGREDEARLLLEEGLRLDPRSAELHNTLAILHAQHGRFAEARAHWEQALEIEPRFDLARQNLQRLQQMGR